MKMPIKIFSVDDQDIFLDALTTFFKPFPDLYELVGSYSAVGDEDGVEDMLETIEDARPDIVLMDFDFYKAGRSNDFGVELTKRIRAKIPDQKIIMLTDDEPNSNDEVNKKLTRSFLAGAFAYLRKDEPHKWLECIRESAIGQKPKMPALDALWEAMQLRLQEGLNFRLSDREVETIQLLAEGKKTRDIATVMGIGFDGVNYHIGNAKIKMSVDTLQGLVAKALRYGVIV